MSGDATFAGTSYQAKVIAYVYAHMLAQARLGWFELLDDTPSAVSGETGGPGDDARIELGKAGVFEVQAKHGMTAGAKLDEFLEHLVSAQASDLRVVLVVNRASSRKLYLELADDLDRMRSGRFDGIRSDTEEVRRKLGSNASILDRLSVLPVDVDAAKDPEWKQMASLLTHVLEDPGQVAAAQAVLAVDAEQLCARKLRRTRAELVALLETAKIRVKPPASDERWHRELDFTLRLLKQAQPEACLTLIEQMEDGQTGQQVSVAVRYRLLQQKAAALLRLDRLSDALSSAMRAIDLDAARPEALRVAALAQLLLANVGAARALVERAIAAAPHDPHAWAVAAQIAATSGEQLPSQPPTDVQTAEPYRLQLAEIAALRGDWHEVMRITEEILATGSREPETLYLQGVALTTLAELDAEKRVDHAGRAERVATEMLEQLRSSHPLAVKALVIRSSAKLYLGKSAEADRDAALALEHSKDDPDALRRRALSLREANDLRGAIALLRNPAASVDLGALALRALLLAENGQKDEARADLTELLAKLSTLPPNEGLCFAAADAAVMLRDAGLAEAALTRAPSRLNDPPYRTVIEGRIAFIKGAFERGEKLFRAVAQGPRRTQLLVEVAIRLQRAGKYRDAVRTFDEVGVESLPKDVLADYASALLNSKALVAAGALLARLVASGDPLPSWAARLGAHLALLQEDPNAAIASLTALTTREPNGPAELRLNLAAALIEVDRVDEANEQLDQLLKRQTELSAIEVARLTLLLKEFGRSKEAIAAGFSGLRRWPNDPQVHRALVVVAMSSLSEFPPPEVVAAGVSVRVETSTGTSKWWTIVESGADPLRGEMTASDAEAAGLLGKPVGCVLTRNAGQWNETKQTITEIVPAALRAVHDAMANFADRFPQEPFFASAFKVGDFTKVGDFAPFLATIEARKKRAHDVFALYEQHTLPLGAAAQQLGVSIPDVMATLASSDDLARHLLVEWSDRDGQTESVSAAQSAKIVVLTRSALATAFDLDLLPLVLQSYTIVVPRSLVRELRLECRRAEKEAAEGKSLLGPGPQGLSLQQLEPRNPLLLKLAADLRRQLDWVNQHARVEPRPLASLQGNEPEGEELRALAGLSSADAVDVARDEEATLYADDLGLRRLLPRDVTRSFSTFGFVTSLLSQGVIDESRHTGVLLDLIERRHAFVPLSRALLMGAVRRYGEFAPGKLSRVFAFLGAPGQTLLEAAALVADLVRTTALSPVHVSSIERIVDLSLEGMSAAWPPGLCAQVVVNAIGEKCTLLPSVVRQSERSAAAFLKRKLTMKVPGA